MNAGDRSSRASRHDVVLLLGMVAEIGDIGARAALLSAVLVGRPYLSSPLIGGPDDPERLVSRLDAFDCVTFVESVWALTRSRHPDDFERQLVALRYHRGAVSWLERNHYMSQWIERNGAGGRLGPVLADAQVSVRRRLSSLEGYPASEQRFDYLPLDRIGLLDDGARDGDLVGFVSGRDDLDTFHVGLLSVSHPGGIRVRHAGRSAGVVVDEFLSDFLARNELPGVMLARPLENPAEEV